RGGLGRGVEGGGGIGHAVIGLAAVDGGDDEAAAGGGRDGHVESLLLEEALFQADEEGRVTAMEGIVGEEGDLLQVLGGRGHGNARQQQRGKDKLHGTTTHSPLPCYRSGAGQRRSKYFPSSTLSAPGMRLRTNSWRRAKGA